MWQGKKQSKIKITKQELIELYVNQHLSTMKIAKKYNCGHHAIRERLIKYGIPLRNNSYYSGTKSHYWKGYKEISGKWWGMVKSRAKKRQLGFDIDIEFIYDLFIKQNKKCALTGLDIKLGLNESASLDRIDSDKGYTKGNVQWVHKSVNHMKNHYKQEYFIDICKKVAEKNA